MSIIDYESPRIGTITRVAVTSDLAGSPIYYHWYLDGAWVGSGQSASFAFHVEPDEQARWDCVDTLDPDFDPVAGAPPGWPARRTLYWNRSLGDVDHYRVEQSVDGSAYEVLGRVPADANAWDYLYLTPRLTDLAEYAWKIVPVDAAGNDGTALTIGLERIVRTPDSPDVDVAFNEGAATVTFSEAT